MGKALVARYFPGHAEQLLGPIAPRQPKEPCLEEEPPEYAATRLFDVRSSRFTTTSLPPVDCAFGFHRRQTSASLTRPTLSHFPKAATTTPPMASPSVKTITGPWTATSLPPAPT